MHENDWKHVERLSSAVAERVVGESTAIKYVPATVVSFSPSDATSEVRLDGDDVGLPARVVVPKFSPPAGTRVMVAVLDSTLLVVGANGPSAASLSREEAVWSQDGPVTVGGSGTWACRFEQATLIELVASLLVAGSSDTTFVFKVNGEVKATIVIPAGQTILVTPITIQIGKREVASVDITGAGTGAISLTVQAEMNY